MDQGALIQLAHVATGDVLPQKLRVIVLDDDSIQLKA